MSFFASLPHGSFIFLRFNNTPLLHPRCSQLKPFTLACFCLGPGPSPRVDSQLSFSPAFTTLVPPWVLLRFLKSWWETSDGFLGTTALHTRRTPLQRLLRAHPTRPSSCSTKG